MSPNPLPDRFSSSLPLSQPRRCMATNERHWAANQLRAASCVMASRQRNSVRILSSRERGSQSFGSQRLLQLLVEEKVRWMKWQNQKVELPDSPRSTFLLAFSPDRWQHRTRVRPESVWAIMFLIRYAALLLTEHSWPPPTSTTTSTSLRWRPESAYILWWATAGPLGA